MAIIYLSVAWRTHLVNYVMFDFQFNEKTATHALHSENLSKLINFAITASFVFQIFKLVSDYLSKHEIVE